MPSLVRSPLARISNLKPLSIDREKEFLENMQTKVVPKNLEYIRQQAALRAELRHKVLL